MAVGARMPLWLLSALRRPASALSILIVVMLATAAAASGPVLLRAAQQSALRTALATAPKGGADIVVSGTTDFQSNDFRTVSSAVYLGIAAARDSTLFHPPVTTTEVANSAVVRLGTHPGLGQPSLGRLRVAARDDGCAAFPIVHGRCPRVTGEVAVPAVLGDGRLAVGQFVTISNPDTPVTLHIVGIYDQTRASALLLADTAPVAGETSAPDLVMDTAAIRSYPAPLYVSARSTPVLSRLTVDEEARALTTVSTVHTNVINANANLGFDSGLPTLLGNVDHDRSASTGLVLVVTAQVVALAWFGAVVIMRLSARVRAREWALGRLRGLPRPAWLFTVYAEPFVLFVLGGALGLALAVLACRAAVHRVLPAGTQLEPLRWPVLLAAGLALFGLAAGLVAASLRGATAPLATLLREGTDPKEISRTASVVEALILTVTAASLYQLVAGNSLVGRGAGLALLAPGLVATSAGLIVIRLLAAAVRRRTRRPARTVGGLLLWRQLVRIPSALQRNIALAIAVALAVFATQVSALSRHNRDLRADAIVGAATVARVQVPAGKDLRQVVDAADASGRQAMAVQERAASSDGDTSRVIAVDTSRLAAIAAWKPLGSGLSDAKLAALLRPKTVAPIVLRGTRLTVHLAAISVTRGPGLNVVERQPPAPTVDVVVETPRGWSSTPLFAVLHDGKDEIGSVSIPCATGCRLVKFVARSTNNAQFVTSFTITAIATDAQPQSSFAAVLRDPTRWQVSATSITSTNVNVQADAGPPGLHAMAKDLGGASQPAFAPADIPDPVPVLVAAATNISAATGQPGAISGTGFDDQRQLFHVVGQSRVVPRALSAGVVVDLQWYASLSDPAASHAVSEVWFAPGRHQGVLDALAKAGVTVQSTQTRGSALRDLGQSATARSTPVDLALAWLAAVLVLALYLTTQVVDSARRRQVWQVARVSGVSRRRMTALAAAEFALPALAGAVLGVLAGLLAIAVAGGRIPLFAIGSVGPPIETSPQWATLALVLAVAAAAVLIAAGLAAAGEASADRSQR